MRVLAIAHVAQSHVLQSPDSIRVLQDMGAALTFASGRDDWVERLPEGSDYRELPLGRAISPRRIPSALLALRRLLHEPWDLVILQTPVAAALSRLAMPRRPPYRSLYIAHGFYVSKDGTRVGNLVVGAIEGLLAGRTDGLAVIAAEDEAWAQRARLDRRTRLYRLPGAGMDVEAVQRSAVEQPLPGTVALFCGELVGKKDPLKAVAAVLAHRELFGSDLGLVVVGDGPLRGAVEAAAAPLRARDRFLLIPRSHVVPGLIKGASVVLLPSQREGVPRVVMEALSAGTPVLCRSNRGTRELLSGFEPGLMRADAPAGDWARAMQALLELHGPSSDDMVARVTRYSSRVFSAAYRSMLDDLLSDAPGSGRPGPVTREERGRSSCG